MADSKYPLHALLPDALELLTALHDGSFWSEAAYQRVTAALREAKRVTLSAVPRQGYIDAAGTEYVRSISGGWNRVATDGMSGHNQGGVPLDQATPHQHGAGNGEKHGG